MDLDVVVPVVVLVGSWALFAVYAAPKILRLIEFLIKQLSGLADWWMSL